MGKAHPKTFEFTVRSTCPAAFVDAWANQRMDHVNQELRPWVYMSTPKAWQQKPIIDWPTQQPLFASWILLLGFIPIDRHQFHFERMQGQDGALGFVERSTSITNKLWQHTRSIAPSTGGATHTVTDHLQFTPKFAPAGYLLRPVLQWLFEHRHRRMASLY